METVSQFSWQNAAMVFLIVIQVLIGIIVTFASRNSKRSWTSIDKQDDKITNLDTKLSGFDVKFDGKIDKVHTRINTARKEIVDDINNGCEQKRAMCLNGITLQFESAEKEIDQLDGKIEKNSRSILDVKEKQEMADMLAAKMETILVQEKKLPDRRNGIT